VTGPGETNVIGKKATVGKHRIEGVRIEMNGGGYTKRREEGKTQKSAETRWGGQEDTAVMKGPQRRPTH